MMRILFLRFGSIGNAMVSVPAVRAVRKELPEAFLALLANPETHELWKDCPWLDRVLVYDQKNEHRAGPGYLKMIAELRKLQFTHSVHFRRFLRSELIGFLAGAKTRVGFDPGRFSLLTTKIPYIEDEPIMEQNLALVRKLGVKAEDATPEYWAPEPSEKVRGLLGQAAGPLVVIHPFARTQREKRWTGFQELTAMLQTRLKANSVLIGAPDDRAVFEKEWRQDDPTPKVVFDLSIPELASLIKSAQLFIGTDSGPLHLAAAVGTPAVCIYSPDIKLKYHLRKWQPLAAKFKAVVPLKNCAACELYPCPPRDMMECMSEISVEEVFDRAKEFLSR